MSDLVWPVPGFERGRRPLRRRAPPSWQRSTGDRVTTDAKDAIHLALLLRLDEITAVTVRRPLDYRSPAGHEAQWALIKAR